MRIGKTLRFPNIALSAFLLLTAGLLSCGPENAHFNPWFLSGTPQPTPPPPETLRILDDTAQPIAGAELLIGWKTDDPFVGNLLTSNAQGEVTLPPDWKTPLPLTVRAQGHIQTTFMEAPPTSQDVVVRRTEISGLFEVQGRPLDFEKHIRPKDGWAEFALLMPLLSKRETLFFDSSRVLSPWSDTLQVGGQIVAIPSNLSLPKQQERYLFYSFELNKPLYRLDLRQNGTVPVILARGRAKISDLVLSRGTEIVNATDITGGRVADLQFINKGLNADFDTDQFQMNQSISVTAPRINKGDQYFVIPFEKLGPLLLPTDLKQLQSGETRRLKVRTTSNLQLLSVWTSTPTSYTLQISDPKMYTDHLKPSQAPAPQAQQPIWKLFPPPQPPKLKALGTVFRYLEVARISNGSYESEIPFTKWEIFATGWVQQIRLPELPTEARGNSQNSRIRRWESLFLAGPSKRLHNIITEDATHVSRAAYDEP